MSLQVLTPNTRAPGKRKHHDDLLDSQVVLPSKRHQNDVNHSTSPSLSLSLQPLQNLVTKLRPKYEVKTLSVISSTSITKRVNAVLTHLGQCHMWDSSNLPGVVLLYARSNSTNKLITIAETVRRRIHEVDQKWYQYNRLYEMEWAAKQQANNQIPKGTRSRSQNTVETLVEDTVMSMDENPDGSDEEDDFEVMQSQQQTVFERAVHGEDKTKQMAHMSIFLSRVPVPELKAEENFTVQSNEEHVNYIRKKKAGLV